ncbi:Arm DNA-binding domain-containing protein [Paraburkholderia heleia]|uniref:Arm DNA-binding domain-containing protein n=1 Tax=Paraburkholderia heleia TaxID=634127 RepID=UPI0038B943A5
MKPDDGPLTDSQVPGLMIRPNANGGKWALRYVSPATRKRREMGLGVYPSTSLRDARVRAPAMRRQTGYARVHVRTAAHGGSPARGARHGVGREPYVQVSPHTARARQEASH